MLVISKIVVAIRSRVSVSHKLLIAFLNNSIRILWVKSKPILRYPAIKVNDKIVSNMNKLKRLQQFHQRFYH